MTVLESLQHWYHTQCDGDWEHQFGASIGTLDNPGWTVTIDLEGTELTAKTFREINDTEKESDWIRCWVADCKFEGVGDPEKLEKILQIFLNWALSVN